MARVRTEVGTVSRTKQEFREETDANVILKRYRASGFLPLTGKEPIFQDVSSGAIGYHAALTLVRRAEASFEAIPAEIRSACGNDAQRFVALLTDPLLEAEAVKLGLLKGPVPVPGLPAEAAEGGGAAGGFGGSESGGLTPQAQLST